MMAASEAAPYAKTGGLADVVGALSKALTARGVIGFRFPSSLFTD
ncbi:MAG: glycogen/starch synthase [Candidatus Manganitrophus sp.]|nr:glycogen/starch synthase [Candidatus Manganitrophus sp.]